LLFTSPLIAAEPTMWCRAEPVSTNGDDYIKYGMTDEEACANALKECEAQYRTCEITGCAKIKEDKEFTSRICSLLEEK
jgi:hypothetical protein